MPSDNRYPNLPVSLAPSSTKRAMMASHLTCALLAMQRESTLIALGRDNKAQGKMPSLVALATLVNAVNNLVVSTSMSVLHSNTISYHWNNGIITITAKERKQCPPFKRLSFDADVCSPVADALSFLCQELTQHLAIYTAFL